MKITDRSYATQIDVVIIFLEIIAVYFRCLSLINQTPYEAIFLSADLRSVFGF